MKVTFYLFHWAKGSAFYTDRKSIAKLTLWEQIDGERAFTPTKKFLTIVVVALCVSSPKTSRLQLREFRLSVGAHDRYFAEN